MWRRLKIVLLHPYDAWCVVGWMSVAEIAVRLGPLPKVAARMGVPLATTVGTSSSAPPALDAGIRRRLLLVDALGRRWPFGGGPCLRQALVAGRVLRRHGPVLRIGASLNDAGVAAHAWVQVGALEIGRSDDFAVLVAAPRP